MLEACYACDAAATSVEHCPPQSFFPEGHRKDLITVPSCPDHNHANSKDVEYTRNWITTSWGANVTGQNLFERKTQKSFDRSPRLLNQTFGSMRTVRYKGEVTGAATCDTPRCKNVFEACARALHYHNTREKHEHWGIVLKNLEFDPAKSGVNKESWMDLLEMLQSANFSQLPTANPEVFQYGSVMADGGQQPIYCFVFYESFVVYALPLSDTFLAASPWAR